MKRVCVCCFSPCHNVKKAVACMGREIASLCQVELADLDFTLPQSRKKDICFSPDDLVLLGTPVYAGRVPNKIMPFIREHIHGNGAKGVPVVAFGNRSFDDALSELYLLMEQSGFCNVAAAAVVSEHSFAESLAPGRPDERDFGQYRQFAAHIVQKLSDGGAHLERVPGAARPEKYYTPLREDGTPARFLKAVPKTDPEKCTHCGACAAVCPMGAVDAENPALTNGICIKCQACIHACKSKARCFDDADFLSHRRMLMQQYARYMESSFYL